MTRAFEIVLTPLIFGGAGWLLDRALGTAPIFMLGLGAFAIVGVFVKMWITYDQEMQREEKVIDHRGRSATSLTATDAPTRPVKATAAGPAVMETGS